MFPCRALTSCSPACLPLHSKKPWTTNYSPRQLHGVSSVHAPPRTRRAAQTGRGLRGSTRAAGSKGDGDRTNPDEKQEGHGDSSFIPEGAKDGQGDSSEDLLSSLGDWREFRARLVKTVPLSDQETSEWPLSSPPSPPAAAPEAPSSSGASLSWAHPLAAPETGCLVIAHPSAFGATQQYFNQAVILIFAHTDSGSAGLILNRPSQYTLSQLAGFDDLLPEFAGSPLYMGGDVGPTSIHCLHGVADLTASGAVPICKGVFLGGYKGCKDHIRSGRSKPSDYHWFARYAGWAPGQLEREVQSGVWYLGACSSDLILKHAGDSDVPLWREVMGLMGDKYRAIAKDTFSDS